MNTIFTVSELNKIAWKIREDVVNMFAYSGTGHFGGSLSIAEIITTLYFHTLKLDPKNPQWPARDRFIISKGHCCPPVYAALARLGFIPKEWLTTFEDTKAPLTMHPDMHKVPGFDASTGALGHGLSIALGMAVAAKQRKAKHRVYCLLGDGELQEGSVWEAIMAAPRFQATNLIAIIDRNGLCLDGPTEEIIPIEPLVDRWRSFGWEVLEVDGHNVSELIEGFQWAQQAKEKPRCVICLSIKGKGVSFMENNHLWHSGKPSKDEIALALEEIHHTIEELN